MGIKIGNTKIKSRFSVGKSNGIWNLQSFLTINIVTDCLIIISNPKTKEIIVRFTGNKFRTSEKKRNLLPTKRKFSLLCNYELRMSNLRIGALKTLCQFLRGQNFLF